MWIMWGEKEEWKINFKQNVNGNFQYWYYVVVQFKISFTFTSGIFQPVFFWITFSRNWRFERALCCGLLLCWLIQWKLKIGSVWKNHDFSNFSIWKAYQAIPAIHWCCESGFITMFLGKSQQTDCIVCVIYFCCLNDQDHKERYELPMYFFVWDLEMLYNRVKSRTVAEILSMLKSYRVGHSDFQTKYTLGATPMFFP